MDAGDFRTNEQSVTVESATEVTIQHVADDGAVTVLRPPVPLEAGEILDATVMSRAQLCDFLAAQLDDAKDRDVLFSLHLKATMMKVSDPIIFGHAVRTFFADVFAEYGDTLQRIGANPNNGLASVLSALQKLPEGERAPIEAAIQATFERRPAVAMVDSDRGITNLHVPSDIIIDASMPPMIRDSGRMWNPAGRAGRHQGRHSRPQLRPHLPGGHRPLPGARRARPGNHGHRPQRRAHGPGRRGVRLPRQDL